MDPPPAPETSVSLKRTREEQETEDSEEQPQRRARPASDVPPLPDEKHVEQGRQRPVICVVSTENPEDDREALHILNRAYDRVETLIARHELKVPFLTELERGSPDVHGFNVAGGGGGTVEIQVQLRHRKYNAEGDARTTFVEFEFVLGTLIHELVHNTISGHGADFEALEAQYREECETDAYFMSNFGTA